MCTKPLPDYIDLGDASLGIDFDIGEYGAVVLNDCPFCGGNEISVDEYKYLSVKPNDWTARCESCLVGFTRATKKKAVAAWNTRHSPDPSGQQEKQK